MSLSGNCWRFPNIDLTPFERTFRAYRASRYKFIQASDGRHEPYDLAADPGEVKNLVTALPSVVGDLQQRLNSWIAKRAVSGVQKFDNIAYDREVAERLKRLGYL